MYGNSRKIVGIWTGSDKEYALPTITPKVGDAVVVRFVYPVGFYFPRSPQVLIETMLRY